MRGRSFQRMRFVQRDNNSISNRRWSLLSDLSFVEDARFYHPEESPSALNIHGSPARFAVVSTPSVAVHRRPFIARRYYTNVPVGVQLPVGIKFSSPFPVVTCLRRKMRKEVLFALGRTKSGRGGSRRRTWRSNVSC